MSPSESARRMWRALEPLHTVVYFAPEPRAATDALGARGGWMSYFAMRAAPLGPAPAELVEATFYGFAPRRVGRAIPAAWAAASPADYLAARIAGVDAALRRLLGDRVDSPELAEAADLTRRAALAAPLAGRPLAAGHAALDWPAEPHLVLWHAQTLLRESRGDGHVAALVCADLDAVASLVVFAADGGVTPERLREARGWTPEEWQTGERTLIDRGLLDGNGALTDAGRDVRGFVEDTTDRAAEPSWAELGKQGCERLVELTAPLVAAVVDGGAFADGNPMGLRLLARA